MAAKHSREVGGEGPPKVSKSNRHDHELLKVESLESYTCTGCKKPGVNFRYQCSTPSCHSEVVNFHVNCATLEDEEQHPIDKDLTFRFRRATTSPSVLPHRCTACDHKLKGFVYETENRDKRLHPLCLVLPSKLKYKGQSYELRMHEGDPYKCCFCNNINKHGWKYMCGDLCMDVGCAKYYFHGLSAKNIFCSPVRRRRDHLKDVAKRVASSVVPAAGVAGGVAGVANCFHGWNG